MISFDTNILMYAAHPRAGAKQKIALDLLLGAESGVLLWQVACEFIGASRKLAAYGFTPAEAWDQLAHYLRSFPLICLRPPCSNGRAYCMLISNGRSGTPPSRRHAWKLASLACIRRTFPVGGRLIRSK